MEKKKKYDSDGLNLKYGFIDINAIRFFNIIGLASDGFNKVQTER